MGKIKVNHLSELLHGLDDLWQGMTEEEMNCLIPLLHVVTLKAGQYLFYEGTASNHLYFVSEGEVCIEKNEQVLATLGSGTYLGEISLLDGKARSASVYATGMSCLYALNIEQLKLTQPNIYAKLIINLAKQLPELVRKTSEVAQESLKNEMAMLRQQNHLGHFLSYIMIVLAIFMVAIQYVEEFEGDINEVTYVRLTIGLALIVSWLALRNKQSFSLLGVNREHLGQSLKEGLWYTFMVVLVSLIFKLYWVNYFAVSTEPFFKITQYDPGHDLFFVLTYFIYAPLQEFIARGCMQSAFAQFFKDRFANVRAIILSNLLFASFYVNLHFKFAALLFVLGLGWGWLYSRHATLLGVALSHALLGMWMSVILGLPVELR